MLVKFDYVSADNVGRISVIDTEFGEEIITNTWEAFVRLYEKHDMNVAGNLALVIKKQSEAWHISFDSVYSDAIANCPRVANYKDEIEKYRLLM
jgi:hypothetical protein